MKHSEKGNEKERVSAKQNKTLKIKTNKSENTKNWAVVQPNPNLNVLIMHGFMIERR